MKSLLRNKPLVVGLLLLGFGQVLYFWNFTTLYIFALWFVLTIGIPYPTILRSLIARMVAATLLVMTIVQLMGALQFLVFPDSHFLTLSLLVTATTALLIWGFGQWKNREPIVLWQDADAAAVLATLFFVLPLAGLCFWHNNPVHLTYLGGYQSPDGSAHYMGIVSLRTEQHLNYRTVEYYPKGFHLASAFVLDGFHADVRELSWLNNARVFFGMYLFWGGVLTYLLFYAGVQWLARNLGPRRKTMLAVLACTVGPTLALLYTLPFVFFGFLNYYYICAAVVLGALYIYEYRLAVREEWRLVLYLLLAFGAAMSWGPLLTPALLLAPALYLLGEGELNLAFVRQLFKRQYWPVIGAFVIQLVPLYLHFRYARLAAAQGINALGIIREFHFGIVLIGLAIFLWAAFGMKATDMLRAFILNVFGPFLVLTGALVGVQYFSVGELRYYAIKTAFLLELFIVTMACMLLVRLASVKRLSLIQSWLVVLTSVMVGSLLLFGLSGSNPLTPARQTFRQLNSFSVPSTYGSDVQAYTSLALHGKLDGANTVDLHYDPTAGKLNGNALLDNWVNLLLPHNARNDMTAACTQVQFSVLAYGTGAPAEQPNLVRATQRCIDLATSRHAGYYIITDAASVPYLQQLFGTAPSYVTGAID